MIDVHSHIIPGIDDGSRSMEMSLTMARQSVDAGVTHVVCTPHIHWGVFDNTRADIEDGFNKLNDAVAKENLPLTLSWAGEVRIKEIIPQWLAENALPFVGKWKGKPVLLLEMPHSHVPAGLDQLLRWLIASGIQPLIPHPERNRDVLNTPDKIQWLRNLGCLLQVTAGAITGRFGDKVQALSAKMIDADQVDIVASDMHDDVRRPNDMGEAYTVVKQRISKERADKLFTQTPGKIVAAQSE
ncbi:tyrosine-protein phosphatase [Alteromonas sp. H39]|uniref:tyrosine-protein phosphatase n=1 Tax=Alteromonas sp. H39 TaxID=3389876 RepID=UPI0039E1A0FD